MADKKVDDLDFSDLDLDMNDDAGFNDEFDNDVGSDDEGLVDEERPAKKKGGDMFTYAVYGVVGLAVVGVIVWQMGLLGGGNTGQPYQAPGAGQQAGGEVVIPGTEAAQGVNGTADPFSVMGTPDQVAPQPNDAAMMEAMNPGTMPGQDGQQPAPAMVDENGMPLPSPTQAQGEMPLTGVLNANDNTPVQPGDTPAATVAGETLPMPAPVPVAPGIEATSLAPVTPTPDAIPVAQPAPTQAAMPVTESAPSSATATAPNAEVMAALQQITARLDKMEARIDAQKSSSDDALASEVKALKATVSELKSSRSSSSTSENKVSSAPAKKKSTPKKSSSAKKSTSTSKNKSDSTWDKPYQGGSAAVSASTGASAGDYTLRAAQPDAAWVSTPNGDLQQVRVGDTVSGLGTVTGITQSGGRWNVQTSGGRISQ